MQTTEETHRLGKPPVSSRIAPEEVHPKEKCTPTRDMYIQSDTHRGHPADSSAWGLHLWCDITRSQQMATTETESPNQNSIVTDLISRISERFTGDRTPCRPDPQHEEVFTLLSNSRRRRVVRLLADADGEMTISELSERIAAAEVDVDRDDLSSPERKRVYSALYQTHIPKLEEHDAVSMDDDGVVTTERRFSDLRKVLQNTTELLE
jgi:DNA-binding transcriptional ArsR family regulator